MRQEPKQSDKITLLKERITDKEQTFILLNTLFTKKYKNIFKRIISKVKEKCRLISPKKAAPEV
jgi:hypothetical protein